MNKQQKIHEFHNRAKAEGDKLKSYVLSISAAGSGIFFAALSFKELTVSESERASTDTDRTNILFVNSGCMPDRTSP